MKVSGDLSNNVEDNKSFTSRPSDLQNYALPLVLCTFKNNKSLYKNIKSIFKIPNQCCCIIFYKTDGRLVKLLLSSTLLDKSPLTFIYFATFEKKKESGLPYPHNQTFWFSV